MSGALVAAAAILSLERICYVWVWHAPDQFRSVADRLPILANRSGPAALRRLFFVFKLIQIGVFFFWCARDGPLWPLAADMRIIAIAIVAMAAGQTLNIGVFRALGTAGVF